MKPFFIGESIMSRIKNIVVILVISTLIFHTSFMFCASEAVLSFFLSLAAGYVFGEFVDQLRGIDFHELKGRVDLASKEILEFKKSVTQSIEDLNRRVENIEKIERSRQLMYQESLSRFTDLCMESTIILGEYLVMLPDYLESNNAEGLRIIYQSLKAFNISNKLALGGIEAEKEFVGLLLTKLENHDIAIKILEEHIGKLEEEISLIKRENNEIRRYLYGLSQDKEGKKAILITSTSGYNGFRLNFLNYLVELLESESYETTSSKDVPSNKYHFIFTVDYSLYMIKLAKEIRCTLHIRLIDRGDSVVSEITEYALGFTEEQAYEMLLKKLHESGKVQRNVVSVIQNEIK